jgi:hypothetical protein
MSRFIDTPYGRKTPDLLVRAMDALTLLPDLLAINDLPKCDGTIDTAKTRRDIKRAYRLAVAKAKALT